MYDMYENYNYFLEYIHLPSSINTSWYPFTLIIKKLPNSAVKDYPLCDSFPVCFRMSLFSTSKCHHSYNENLILILVTFIKQYRNIYNMIIFVCFKSYCLRNMNLFISSICAFTSFCLKNVNYDIRSHGQIKSHLPES